MDTCYTLITAHSGCNNTPPNSLGSVITGMESGADFVEVDVRTTKDGLPVLFHDGFMKTENHGLVNICDYSLSELNNFIKSDSIMKNQYSEIITFTRAVSIAKDYGCFLNVDIKDDSCIDPMVTAVKDANMVDSVIITGCKYKRAVSLKKKYPEFQVLLNIGHKLLLEKEKSASVIAEEVCRMAVDASCCGINIEFNYLTEELVQTARRRFLPISIWTLTKDENLDDYLKLGLYSITTTAVSLLLEKRKRHTVKMALPGILPENI
jgi:glycerophosphoryl diester phosphodiesterase